MTIYIATTEQGRYYGAFKTQKHLFEHFGITKTELKKILRPNSFIKQGGQLIKIKTETIY
jgi:hypothetical protein